ncbi:MAG TPA: sigma factor [Ktedonobacterales bacterium]|nr:sigma factor [Ktedonobacterales bacterium]
MVETPMRGEGPSVRVAQPEGVAPMTDAERFAQQVPPLVPAMLRVAAALVGSADAEDAAQEAITRAWQSWSILRDAESLRPWLLRITVNLCYQWHPTRNFPMGRISSW